MRFRVLDAAKRLSGEYLYLHRSSLPLLFLESVGIFYPQSNQISLPETEDDVYI